MRQQSRDGSRACSHQAGTGPTGGHPSWYARLSEFRSAPGGPQPSPNPIAPGAAAQRALAWSCCRATRWRCAAAAPCSCATAPSSRAANARRGSEGLKRWRQAGAGRQNHQKITVRNLQKNASALASHAAAHCLREARDGLLTSATHALKTEPSRRSPISACHLLRGGLRPNPPG
jgi:hypothetical protein